MCSSDLIKSPGEAEAFLTNDTLRNRYLDITTEVLHRLEEGVNPTFLMGGSTDRDKLISSATLFEHFSAQLGDGNLHATLVRLLTSIETRGSQRCARTMQWIAG